MGNNAYGLFWNVKNRNNLFVLVTVNFCRDFRLCNYCMVGCRCMLVLIFSVNAHFRDSTYTWKKGASKRFLKPEIWHGVWREFGELIGSFKITSLDVLFMLLSLVRPILNVSLEKTLNNVRNDALRKQSYKWKVIQVGT